LIPGIFSAYADETPLPLLNVKSTEISGPSFRCPPPPHSRAEIYRPSEPPLRGGSIPDSASTLPSSPPKVFSDFDMSYNHAASLGYLHDHIAGPADPTPLNVLSLPVKNFLGPGNGCPMPVFLFSGLRLNADPSTRIPYPVPLCEFLLICAIRPSPG